MADEQKNNHEHDHDCDCGCDHEDQTMTLVLDDGSELKCTVIDIFDLDEDRAYIALLPIGEEEVLLYKYVENEDESFELLNIESDEEFEEVENAFFELYDEGAFDDILEIDTDEDFEDEDFEDEDEE